ncbi:histidine kinase [Gordonia terrae]
MADEMAGQRTVFDADAGVMHDEVSLRRESDREVMPWSEALRHSPDGLAVIDDAALFVQLNPAGVELCGRDNDDLIGMPSPFNHPITNAQSAAHTFYDDPAERVCTWAPIAGDRRQFAYRVCALPQHPGRSVVAFRDVTAELHRRRRITAIARASANVASQGSISAILDAVAREVLQAEPLSGVQILTFDESGEGLRIMGSAGFRRWPDFFERLVACRERGAPLRMLDALQSCEPVVVPDRWRMIESDPTWEPLRDYLGELEWSWFASVPLMIRGRAAGVMNCFFAPGHVVGGQTLSFLLAMAEQAAVAIDYASLLKNEREHARREERQRLARDLHDSIVQQVFSIGMQAKSMGVLGARAEAVPASSVRRIADEVGVLSKTVLTDLRAMVHQLRPPSSTQLGLEEALRALVESTTNRTGLRFSLSLGGGLQSLPTDMAEDIYRILAEAIHNVVKHADASTVTIRTERRASHLVVEVKDDGSGIEIRGGESKAANDAGGYGLIAMRERAEQWSGTVVVEPRAAGGTVVRARIPLNTTLQALSGSGDHDESGSDEQKDG